MVESLCWQGDHEGHLVLNHRASSGELKAQVIDRPGDIVATILSGVFEGEGHLTVAAVYGVCLAMRGVHRPEYINQVLEKAIRFVHSANPESMQLFRTLRDLRSFVETQGELDGYELRERVHGEARRLHEELW